MSEDTTVEIVEESTEPAISDEVFVDPIVESSGPVTEDSGIEAVVGMITFTDKNGITTYSHREL